MAVPGRPRCAPGIFINETLQLEVARVYELPELFSYSDFEREAGGCLYALMKCQ